MEMTENRNPKPNPKVCNEVIWLAQGQGAWRKFVSALCSSQSEVSNKEKKTAEKENPAKKKKKGNIDWPNKNLYKNNKEHQQQLTPKGTKR